jgi:SAM-dependent methyltransferase
MPTRKDRLQHAWEAEERAPFAGWDFAHLDGRMIEEQPPWDYMQRAAELLDQASAVLDIGTGGGERLLALRAHWPPRVVATEDYPPNVRLATERLAPLGVQVIQAPVEDVSPLPLAAESIDLALNRHSALDIGEIARVLTPGGRLYTQQVHGLWANDLLEVFGATPAWPEAAPARYLGRLQQAGMTVVDAQEWQGQLAFTDVGAVVYYLRAVPWLVRGFSVASHLGALLALQQRLDEGEALAFTARLYMIEACKPT